MNEIIKCDAKIIKSKSDTDVDFRLSVSKSKTFDSCKKKFKYNYIEKLPRKDWDFHIFGKFLHQVLENFHAKLLADRELEKDWSPVLDESWDEAKEEYKKDLTAQQEVDAADIVDTYRDILKEDGLPEIVSVEANFNIVLADTVVLNGFIDRVQVDPDGMLHVADYKTTKDKKYLKDYFQLETYAFALMLENPEIKKMRASYVMLRHNFDYLTEEFTREEIMGTVGQKFLDYAEKIKAERTWRAQPQFLCKFCDFVDTCQEGTDYLIRRGIIDKAPKVGLMKW